MTPGNGHVKARGTRWRSESIKRRSQSLGSGSVGGGRPRNWLTTGMPRQARDLSRMRPVRSNTMPNAFGRSGSAPAPLVRISLMVLPRPVRIRPRAIRVAVGAGAHGAAWSESGSLHPSGAEHTGLAVIVDGVGSPTGARHSCQPVRIGRPASRLRAISLTTAVHSRMGRTAYAWRILGVPAECIAISELVCSAHSQYFGKRPMRAARLTRLPREPRQSSRGVHLVRRYWFRGDGGTHQAGGAGRDAVLDRHHAGRTTTRDMGARIATPESRRRREQEPNAADGDAKPARPWKARAAVA